MEELRTEDRVVILVRSTADYNNMNDESFGSQVYDAYKPKIELHITSQNESPKLWSETFHIDYFKYRSEIVRIADQARRATGCFVISGVDEFIEWYQQPGESILVPTDDDDWVSPDIGQLAFDQPLARWPEYILGTINRPKLYITEKKFGSNNWAIKKSFLKNLDDKQARHITLLSHKHAVKFFGDAKDVTDLKQIFSVYNRHVGSLTHLRNVCESKETLHRPICEHYTAPSEIAWCQTYINQLTNANRRL